LRGFCREFTNLKYWIRRRRGEVCLGKKKKLAQIRKKSVTGLT